MSKARDLADILKASGKLANVETNADVTDTLNVTGAGALMDSELAGLAAVKATTGTFLTADQTKLDNITPSANNYTHPTGAGDKHIPTAGANGQFLKYDSSGTAVWAADNNTVYVHPNHSGDVVSAADGAMTIQTDAVDIAMLSATGTASPTTFLRGDNSWQVVSSPLLDSPSITGTLSVDNGGNVSHTIANWSDDITYVITPTNCTVGAVNTSGVFVVTHTSGSPSYTIKATTDSLGLDDSALVTKNLSMNLSAPTLSSPANTLTLTNVVYTITSTDTGDDKIILDIGSSNFTFQSVSVGSASKVGNTVVCTGFTTNNPVVTIQFTVQATYSVTAKSVNIAGTYGDSASSSADSITIINNYDVDFLVIAGGGGTNAGGNLNYYYGGGGGGGLRTSYGSTSGAGSSAESSMTFNGGVVYSIDVGGGGASQTSGQNSSLSGSDITTITSTGGGRSGAADNNGTSGGCGGGGGGNDNATTGGSGTTGQGYAGGSTDSGNGRAGAGGGSPSNGGGNNSGQNGGAGGSAFSSSITGSTVTYSAGGLGCRGWGGSFGTSGVGWANAANRGHGADTVTVGSGSSGVVILRMPTTGYSGTSTGSPTVDSTTVSGTTILTFTGDGTYTG